MRETHDGGLNTFRRRYRIATPLRLESRDSWPIDEHALYARFRGRRHHPDPDGLRIVLAGELAFNPERVLAFEERGHQLYGVWIEDPLADQTVGPLPFGHVRDLPDRGWREAIRAVRPDVIYGLLNWRAIPLVHTILDADLGVPLVWHFKEAPQRCLVRGTWPLLADLHRHADAAIYSTALERDWFEAALPGTRDPATTHVVDGDLPKADWFDPALRPRLSDIDGQIHTVSLGRPVGFDAGFVGQLAAHGIHLHLYGLVRAPGPKGAWTAWIDDAVAAAPDHLHIHPHVDPRSWSTELSQYDAGWMHRVISSNRGDLTRATWDDLNAPARLSVLAAAGVPVLQQASPGSAVAVQNLVAERGIGMLYDDVDDLAAKLHDTEHVNRCRGAVATQGRDFTFDAHVDRLLRIFRSVVR
ncbi:MAG: hypothetical protein M3N57_07995 [Actinomycetota bacterium]|nr:hypothetical protein [Actinomycetota bacterium]